jgi:hypothetical protein
MVSSSPQYGQVTWNSSSIGVEKTIFVWEVRHRLTRVQRMSDRPGQIGLVDERVGPQSREQRCARDEAAAMAQQED